MIAFVGFRKYRRSAESVKLAKFAGTLSMSLGSG